MDQREWDYGARLPRERSGADPWPPTKSPESPDSSQVIEPGAPVWGSGSVTDTGSMQPIPEAVAWSLRAEAWAKNEDQAVERSNSGAVSRWSDVAATGRPPIPADGVGWRTSTAEWRATSDSAHWRQTTEWRSASGRHGWRTTTEAWQAGDAEGFTPPATEPPTRLPAISGTAWPTPETIDQSSTPATPAWQQPGTETPSWQQPPSTDTPSWQQRPADATPSWQQRPADAAPSWQQRPADAAPSWQQRPADAAPSWQQPPADAASRQQGPADAAAWQQYPADAAPSWQRAADGPLPAEGRRQAEWERPPDAQRPADAAPSWHRVEERPSWQQFTAPPTAPPTPPWETPAASWPQPADAPRSRPSWDSRPSWQQFTDSTRSGAREIGSGAPESSPSWQNPQPGRFDDGRHLVREDDRAQWRRESAAGQAGLDDGSRSAGRRRASDPGSRTSGGTGWTVRSDADNWAGHTDTGSIPAFQDPATDTPTWRRDAPPPATDTWRTSSTTNSWQSSAPATDGRRTPEPWRSAEPMDDRGTRSDGWRTADEARGARSDGWRTDGPADDWRNPEPGPPSDPWAQSAAETGVIPLPLQPREGDGWQSRTDTGSWQRDPATDRNPRDGGRRSRADRADTGSWQRDPDRRETTGSFPRDPDRRDGTGSFTRDDRRDSTGSFARDDRRDSTGSFPRDDRRENTGSLQRDPDRGEGTGSWQREDPRDDTGSWRQDPESGARQGRADTGSWQRDPEATRGRRPARPRGPETQREPRRGLDAQRGAGMSRRDGAAAYARRREPDTSWQRELESGSWHRDPESDVWLRDADTGQWHRAEVDDDEDDEDDRDDEPRPRRRRARPDDNVPGGPLAIESGDDETAPWRSTQGDTGSGGRRRAPDGPLQIGARAETPLDPEVYRRGDEPPARWTDDLDDARTRPITGRARELEAGPASGAPAARNTAPAESSPWPGREDAARSGPASRPVSSRPYGSARPDAPEPDDTARSQPDGTTRSQPGGTARPVSSQPGGTARPVSSPYGGTARPVSSQPGGGAARPASAQPGGGAARPTSAQPGGGAARPTSAQPGAWRPEAQAEARTEAWRSQLRAEAGEAPPTGGAPEIPAWQQADREQAAGGAAYRGGRTGDWRRELKAESNLADGESRRFGTSDFVPFRPPSKNGASASVKVPAANSASEGLTEVIQRTGTSWQDPPDTVWPPKGAVMASSAGAYERRPVSTFTSTTARQNDLLEPEEELEEDTGGPLAAVGYTVVWYGVPVVLFVLYMLVLNGAQQAHALSTLAGAAPQFGLSLVLSMLVAVGLRRASGSWKAASVGLAAAVMGGGLATVLTSAITGQSLS
ncbi:hypothetical protein [Actinoplanes sp. NPDC049681]|uniref:hypothetical protein n=1 Tax=Actinoplanes sp. NPDC049681 TaxID=3363905 RepID=UPI0037A0749D